MSEMNETDKLEHIRALNRERQKRYYEKNKAKILEKNKEDRIMLKECKKEKEIIVEPKPEPKPEQQNEQQKTTITNEKTTILVKKNKKEKLDLLTILKKIEELPMDSEKTRKTYINSIKSFFHLTKCDNFANCLKNFDFVKNAIETGKKKQGDGEQEYSLNSKKGIFQTIVFLIDNLNIKIPNGTKQKYKDFFEAYKLRSKKHTDEKKEFSVSRYSNVLRKIKEKFPNDSKQVLFMEMYNEIPCRDNFILKIVSSREAVENDDNFLVVPEKGKISIIIQEYKTKNKYDIIDKKFSLNVSKMIRNYISKENIETGNYLFGNSKYLTAFVKNMLLQIDIDVKGASINYLRQAKINEELEKVGNEEERVQLAKKFQHSPIATLLYVRKLND